MTDTPDRLLLTLFFIYHGYGPMVLSCISNVIMYAARRRLTLSGFGLASLEAQEACSGEMAPQNIRCSDDDRVLS